MATEKSALRIVELDFDDIRENLKNYLRSQTEFKDYDFEGSGMSVLLDILSYNTHYMSYYLNMVGNEMFLDSAQLRASVLSHAKHINYIPGSKQGALSKINIQITPSNTEDQNANFVTLDKYTRLLGADKDGVNYPFVTLYSNTATKNGNSFFFSNVMIKQGEVITLQYLADASNPQRKFEIPSQNVDTTTISVTVQESSTNVDTSVYTLNNDITEVNANSKVYFLEENENLNYTLYFGDDVIGKKPKDGNVIIVTYLDNVGSVSNNISNFVFSEAIGDEYRDNVIVTSTGSSYGGVEKENIEQVRFRAPFFYTTQNRAVTAEDYKTLILKEFPIIESISVWGGEENEPVVYGKVYISLKTKGNFVLTELEKLNIIEKIRNRSIFTVQNEVVDPDFSFLVISGKVYFDSRRTTRTANEIVGFVNSAISDYNDTELNSFESVFRKSKLQFFVENSEPSITGSDIDVFLQKRITLDLNEPGNYTLNFNTSLRKGNFDEKIYSFPQITVRDVEGVARNVFFEEEPLSFTGIDSISIINPGNNYQTAPTVNIIGDGVGATAQAFIVNGKIDRIEVTNKGSNYTTATVSLTGGGGREASAIAVLQNNNGVLRTYYFRSNGEKVIVNPNAGTIDYIHGRINLINLLPLAVLENDLYDDNVLTFSAPIEEQNLYPLRNRILLIDENLSSSIQINAVAEK